MIVTAGGMSNAGAHHLHPSLMYMVSQVDASLPLKIQAGQQPAGSSQSSSSCKDDELLLALREGVRDAPALLAMQAGLVLRCCVPEGGVEGAQEDLRDSGRCFGEGACRQPREGLAGGAQMGGAHGGDAGKPFRCPL